MLIIPGSFYVEMNVIISYSNRTHEADEKSLLLNIHTNISRMQGW
jgi:hypothetical protein